MFYNTNNSYIRMYYSVFIFMAGILISGTIMDTHGNWRRSVIESFDLEVSHIILAFGLPPPTNVLLTYCTLRKIHLSSKTPMIQWGCREKHEAYGDSLKKSRWFWKRTKNRLLDIFWAVCRYGYAIRYIHLGVFLMRRCFYYNYQIILWLSFYLVS